MGRVKLIAAALVVVALSVCQSGCIYSQYKASISSLEPDSWREEELDQKEDFVEVKDGKLVLRRVKIEKARTIIYPQDFANFWKGGNDGGWLPELVCRFPTMWLEMPFALLNDKESTSDFETPVLSATSRFANRLDNRAASSRALDFHPGL